jgi:tryptophan-rich sensory protein
MEQTNTYAWYARLIKPSFAPPSWLFGPVWTVLYAIIAVTFGTVFYKAFTRELPLSIWLPFALNLVFNAAFTPLQFGLRNNYLASVDIVLLLVTLIWALVVVYPRLPLVTYANLPYLLWVSFATVLQLSITYLNR